VDLAEGDAVQGGDDPGGAGPAGGEVLRPGHPGAPRDETGR